MLTLCLPLRSLCVDALIELSDENADWKLSLTEFTNCLTPTYHPYERSKNTQTFTNTRCKKLLLQCNSHSSVCIFSCVCMQSVLWRMRCLRTGLKLAWSVTSVCVPVETGSALLSPAQVRTHMHIYTFTHSSAHIKLYCLDLSFFFLHQQVLYLYNMTICVAGEHQLEEHIQEEDGEGEEMTEEEWSKRVAELNALQEDNRPWRAALLKNEMRLFYSFYSLLGGKLSSPLCWEEIVLM